jgi:hypothetical protein
VVWLVLSSGSLGTRLWKRITGGCGRELVVFGLVFLPVMVLVVCHVQAGL